MPSVKRFVWNAAKGQLELFASLGVRDALARAVIANVDGAQAGGEQKGTDTKPQHLVVFVGHRVDEPTRPREIACAIRHFLKDSEAVTLSPVSSLDALRRPGAWLWFRDS